MIFHKGGITIGLLLLGIGISSACTPSLTTVSGYRAPQGQLCSGDLILSDDFNNFDMNLWQHEISLGGGGVSTLTKSYS